MLRFHSLPRKNERQILGSFAPENGRTVAFVPQAYKRQAAWFLALLAFLIAGPKVRNAAPIPTGKITCEVREQYVCTQRIGCVPNRVINHFTLDLTAGQYAICYVAGSCSDPAPATFREAPGNWLVGDSVDGQGHFILNPTDWTYSLFSGLPGTSTVLYGHCHP